MKGAVRWHHHDLNASVKVYFCLARPPPPGDARVSEEEEELCRPINKAHRHTSQNMNESDINSGEIIAILKMQSNNNASVVWFVR